MFKKSKKLIYLSHSSSRFLICVTAADSWMEFFFGLGIFRSMNNRPSPPHMSLSSLYVGLSRVRSSNCLRLLPKQTSKPDFEHLLKLKIPVSILRWKKGFDLQTGIWSRHATHSETNENVSTRKRGRKSK